MLPDLPTQRNHITGAAINGRIHIVGGRLGNGLSPLKSTAHEVFDPQTRTWTAAAPMLSGRSGINGVMARGCFHVWGGEAPTGMTPDHDYYVATSARLNPKRAALSVARGESGELSDTVVTLGKQLSKRWFVAYETGLNAAAGSWQLIYRAARRFTLRAQSGEDSAVDVIWTWRWN